MQEKKASLKNLKETAANAEEMQKPGEVKEPPQSKKPYTPFAIGIEYNLDKLCEQIGSVSPDLSKFEVRRISAEKEVPRSEPFMTISGKRISKRGNITAISGASKSGKTAFTNAIIAACISPDGNIAAPFDGLYVEANASKKAVLHFDTEQSEDDHQDNVISILKRAQLSKTPDYFLSYNIRDLDRKSYAVETMEICLRAEAKHGGIHAMFIDGIADYIADVNSTSESADIVKFFMAISKRFFCPVFAIVHTNPSGEKERGHLGSEIQRKADSTITVKKDDDDISYLDYKLLRKAGKNSLQDIRFEYNEEMGFHAPVYGRPNINGASGRPSKEQKIAEMPAMTCYKIVTECLTSGIVIKSKNSLIAPLTIAYQKITGDTIGRNNMLPFIARCEMEKWIYQDTNKKYTLGNYDK